MVLAEMIAVGELEGLARPGTSLDLKRPITAHRRRPRRGRRPRPRRAARAARRRHRAHRRGRRARSRAGSTRRSPACACSSTTCCRATTSATTGEHRDVLEAYRMFAYDRGWVRRMHEAIRNGLSAEAAVEKVQSDTRARLQRQTDPFLRDRLHDFDDLANRLLRVLMNKPHGPSAARLPQGRDHRRPHHGRRRTARLRPRAGARPGAGGGRADQPRHHRRARARHRHRRPGRRTSSRSCENGDAIIVDGDAGEVHLRPTADVEAAYAEKVRFRAQAAGAVPAAARQAGGHPRRPARHAADECRPAGRPAASRRVRRRGHRPVPHRAAVHDRRDACRS